jgi:hypothetical protein
MLMGLLAACVSMSTYDQLNQRLSAEIAQGQVHITRLQGAIKIAVNSELLFPSGGWEMPPQAAQTIAEMAPVLAPMQTAHITVIGRLHGQRADRAGATTTGHCHQWTAFADAGADRDAVPHLSRRQS